MQILRRFIQKYIVLENGIVRLISIFIAIVFPVTSIPLRDELIFYYSFYITSLTTSLFANFMKSFLFSQSAIVCFLFYFPAIFADS